jgi:integrase
MSDPAAISAQEYARFASAPETRRASARQWKSWFAWATLHDVPPLPAEPSAVADYLAELASLKTWAASSTAQALWAIDRVSRQHGHTPPGAHPRVRLVLSGIRRKAKRQPKAQRPLTIADIDALPRARRTPLTVRDWALLLVGFAAALRRSELVALDLADVHVLADHFLLAIRSSKTDQSGHGATVPVVQSTHYPRACPVLALRAWLDLRGPDPGPLFVAASAHKLARPYRRLSGSTVDAVVKRTAAALGLKPDRFGGHSLRAGSATYLSRQGVPLQAIAKHGRWQSINMVLRYCRDDSLDAVAGAM